MDENQTEFKEQIQELSFFERLIAFFVDTKSLFSNVRDFGIKTIDYIVPLIIVSIIAIFVNFYYMNSEYFRVIVLQKQNAKIQEQLEEQVNKKAISKEKANEIMEQTQKNTLEYIEKMKSPVLVIIQFFSTLFAMLFFMLIISAFFKFCFKFIAKIDIIYKLLFYLFGLTLWFGALDILLSFILTIISGNIISSLALSNLLNINNFSMLFWLNKISIFSFLSYIWIAKGISIIKGIETKKSFLLTFSFWILGNLLVYILAINIPFFKNFVQLINE